jgi:hypothetical protein
MALVDASVTEADDEAGLADSDSADVAAAATADEGRRSGEDPLEVITFCLAKNCGKTKYKCMGGEAERCD